ncbi:MAG: terminase family protein [Anaerolineae bacterium]|nr:terminase family protein [Anaerolineae bacterium]
MGSIAADLALALDPVLMAQAVGLEPDPWQVRLLRSGSDRILLNCCRQSGKSTMAAILALHTALYQPASLVLLLSPALRQSQELFRKVVAIYRALAQSVPAETETKLTLELEGGARIVSLPGKESTIRGFSAVRLLIVDEAARVPDELYYSVRPMLAVSGGRLIALSTPFGTRGWWHEAWRSADRWERFEVPASECPRIPAAFLEEERRNLGEWWFAQEYECRFLDAETAAFRSEDVEQAFTEGVEPWRL